MKRDLDTQLMIEGLQARIRTAKEHIAACEQRISELEGQTPAKVLPGRWDGRTKEARAAKAKADKPKKRKMSAAARKRISDGLKASREKKQRLALAQEQEELQNAPQPQERHTDPNTNVMLSELGAVQSSNEIAVGVGE